MKLLQKYLVKSKSHVGLSHVLEGSKTELYAHVDDVKTQAGIYGICSPVPTSHYIHASTLPDILIQLLSTLKYS